jgi:hypothetical protein
MDYTFERETITEVYQGAAEVSSKYPTAIEPGPT